MGKRREWRQDQRLVSCPADPLWWPFGCQASYRRIQQRFPSSAWIDDPLYGYRCDACITWSSMHDWFFLVSTSCHHTAHRFPVAPQCLTVQPRGTTTNPCFSLFSLLTIRLIVLSLACALKSLTFFSKVSLLKMWIPRFHSRPIKSVSLAWGLRNKYFLEVPLMVPVPGEGWESLP